MHTDVAIERAQALPVDLETELLRAAKSEGFSPIEWLKTQWLDGSNRFMGPGEGLFTARLDGRLVAVCGLNRDPYDTSERMGRLRRLYVLPGLRRRGIGRQLVEHVLAASWGTFRGVNLRTLDRQSAAFFETLGFGPVEGIEEVTHRVLDPRSS